MRLGNLINTVLKAMQESRVSDFHFNSSTGYGYGDIGRDTIEKYMRRYLKQKKHL